MIFGLWDTVPELTPPQVGTPVPISTQVDPDSYTYDYIIVGGGYILLVSAIPHLQTL